MYIVILGWLYLVLMMAATSKTLVSGLLLFIFLGLLPCALLMYAGGWRIRRKSVVLPDQHSHSTDGKNAQGD
jgi:biotin transporter BioY